MKTAIVGALAGIMLAGPALAQAASPMDFLRAADRGDVAAMEVMLEGRVGLRGGTNIGAGKFMKMIEGCYLRRASAAPAGQMMASWMCKDGEGSKIVLARVVVEDGELALEGVAETPMKWPAPPRTGSALAGL
ncbi:hypothetical protein [Polymorphobacter sp.]|uniref:hypothetical protein n=1 Tax=Polymorphobacter sp. TaxID=1909290 RepID=UPI003F6F40D7